jgi:hypothetical protein
MAIELLQVLSVQCMRQWHDIVTLDESWAYLSSEHDLMWTAPREIVVDRERHTVQSSKFMRTCHLDTKLEEAHERLDEIEAKSGGLDDPEGEIAKIIVIKQRMEGSQTVIMTQLHKEPTKAFVSQEELTVSLVLHVDELKDTLKELKDDLEHLKDMRKDLRCIKYNITKLKR